MSLQIALSCFLLIVATDAATNHETSLFNYLFGGGYSSRVRPKSDTKDAVDVTVEFELITIGGLAEVDQIMYTTGFISTQWTDDFLKWTPAAHNGIEHIVVPPTTVWLPDLGIYNSADTFYQETFSRDFRVDIKYTGRVMWEFGGNFATSCTLVMTYYPFDIQKCDIIIDNWAYSMDQVNLLTELTEIHLQEFSVNGEWDLQKTEVAKTKYTIDTHPGKYFPRVTFSMYLARKPDYYFFNIVTPCLFIILIAIMVFWLPPESGEKVSLGVTVLLAFSVFNLVVADNTPKTSDFTPMLSELMTAIMGMATLSVVTSIIVLYMHHHNTASRPPKWLRTVAFKGLARLFCIRNEMPEENEIGPSDDDELTLTSDIELEKKPVKQEGELAEIATMMKYLVDVLKEKEKIGKVEDEWRACAVILDRCFFWITVIATVIMLPVFLVQNQSHD